MHVIIMMIAKKSRGSKFNNLIEQNGIVIKYFIIKRQEKKEPLNRWVKLRTNSGRVPRNLKTSVLTLKGN